ncbi:MAG: vacuolar transporter chaperone 1 [Piptocephalis tieghemiana]|nr:MAG: vacuolar transporter chaperone 1 [Piptocephalis tieghemiana]
MSFFTASGPEATARRRQKIINIPVRVEPKVYLANERTLLHWLNFSVIIASLALTLLNFGDWIGRVAAVGFTVVAAALACRGLRIFLWRSERIRQRDQVDYADRWGPFMLVTSILAVIGMNMWMRLVESGVST